MESVLSELQINHPIIPELSTCSVIIRVIFMQPVIVWLVW